MSAYRDIGEQAGIAVGCREVWRWDSKVAFGGLELGRVGGGAEFHFGMLGLVGGLAGFPRVADCRSKGFEGSAKGARPGKGYRIRVAM